MRVQVWTGGHTIAESLFLEPPESVQIISNAQAFVQKNREAAGERMFVVPDEAKKFADRAVYALGIPRFLPTLSKADIIHTISGLVPTVPRPWVTTISMPSSFFGLNDEWYTSRRRRWILRKTLGSSNCKKITCFSESTLNGLKWCFGMKLDESISSKFEVMYPAINPERFIQRRDRDNGPFRILFIGNHFFDKGGRDIYRAVERLAPKYDIALDIVTNAPPHHKEALQEFMKHNKAPWANWYVPGVSRRRLIEEFFPAADVFAMCSYMEVFGFVFIEAMACGLPIIAANVYAQREIVNHGMNGYLITAPICAFEGQPQVRTQRSVERYRSAILSEKIFEPVVDQIEEHLRTLIDDSRLREKMSRKSLEMATNGRFSIGERNRQLKRIYEEALQ